MTAHWISIPATALMILSTTPVLADESLARKSGCFECHGADRAIKSPTFQDIADKYRNDPDARAALIKTVKHGGKGNWTAVTGGAPMPPYSPRLSDKEIAQLVDWVLDH
nr:c-type cytochrome [Nitrosomonas nitrosa]